MKSKPLSKKQQIKKSKKRKRVYRPRDESFQNNDLNDMLKQRGGNRQ